LGLVWFMREIEDEVVLILTCCVRENCEACERNSKEVINLWIVTSPSFIIVMWVSCTNVVVDDVKRVRIVRDSL
jgi:hypothetical protein